MKIKFHIKKLLSICFLFFLTPYPLSLIPDAHAEIPDTITYQGRLSHQNQRVSGNIPMTFSIYNDLNVQQWTESDTVKVSTGVFYHSLGSQTSPITVDWAASGRSYYLRVDVNGEELSPRMKFESVPFSFVTKQLWGNNIVTTSAGRVGIGVPNPTTEILEISGNIDVTGTIDGVDVGANGASWSVDISTLNEIQTLDVSGNNITLSNGGGSVTVPYATNAGNANTVDGQSYSSSWPTTLSNIQSVCSNDFHNIGGTDDDEPDNDADVSNNISINNGLINATVNESSVTISGSLNILNQPGCTLYDAGGSISDYYDLEFDNEVYDPNGMHVDGAHEEITIPTGQGGRYLIISNTTVMVFPTVTGALYSYIRVNGSTISTFVEDAVLDYQTALYHSVIVELDADDIITVRIIEDNTDSVSLMGGRAYTYICVQKLD